MPQKEPRQHQDANRLRELLLRDPVLQAYERLLPSAFILSAERQPDRRVQSPLTAWERVGDQMVILVNADWVRVAVCVFRVLGAYSSAFPLPVDTLTVQIIAFAFVVQVDDEQHAIHVISHGGTGALEYQHVFVRRANHILHSSDIDVPDLLERFPGHAENILDQIACLASVLLFEDPTNEVCV